MDITTLYQAVQARVVGREKETQLILAALGAGRDLLLEGPPGTSKSTILRAITDTNRMPFYFVEGNADLTPTKLVGHHSPSRVLQEDYTAENFIPGPLPLAMQKGGLLYIEEFNRVPEDTLNTLITAMAERELTIPRVGTVQAADTFRVIAAMNPFDSIGTGRLSGALADRLCRVRMAYQPEEEEVKIVARRTGSQDRWLIRLAVRAMRLTRAHPDLRMGASVRAAIDFVLVAEQMALLRGLQLSEAKRDGNARQTLIEAGQTTFSIKIAVREAARRKDDDIVAEVINAALDSLEDVGSSPESPGEAPDTAAPEGEGEGTPSFQRPRGHMSPKSGAGTTPSSALTAGGRIYSGDEAMHTAAARPRGDRMFTRFRKDYPKLGEKLEKGKAGPAELEKHLRALGLDPLDILGQMASFYDRSDLRALARRLAIDLIIRDARRNVSHRSGRGKLTSVPYRGEATEIDLERTLESLAGKPHPRDEDFFIWERRRRQRSYALMLDVSGSMQGKKIFYAALALAAVAVRVQKNPFAVIAFWREAAILKQMHARAELDELLDRLLSLSGRGLTNVGLGLQAGLDELDTARTQERIGILFSDGLQTAGPPAGPLAAAFPTLHVVGTGESEESIANCYRLAQRGHGRCAIVSQAGGISEAVNACLAN